MGKQHPKTLMGEQETPAHSNGALVRRGKGRPAQNGSPLLPSTPTLPDSQEALGLFTSRAGVDLTDKLRDLVRLAREQGHLTYDDVNDALSDGVVTPQDLDQIHIKLRNLEIDIIDPAELERAKKDEGEEEEETSRIDILDDPVRMYLKQMGRVALLSREQ